MSVEHKLMRLLKHPRGNHVSITLSDHTSGVRISVNNLCSEILWYVGNTAEDVIDYALLNFETALYRHKVEKASRMLKSMQELRVESERTKENLKNFLRSNGISRSSLSKK